MNCFRAHSIALAVAMGVALAWPQMAQAHLGPPFPVITDQSIPGYDVTVLTNPDTTQAVVYVVLEPKPPAPAPAVAQVDVWIQPLDRHAGRSSYVATKEYSRDTMRFFAQPNFDTVGRWYLGVNLRMANGARYRFITSVDATPPGIGRWGLLLFAAPLLLFGSLFVAVVVRRRRSSPQRRNPQCTAQPSTPIERRPATADRRNPQIRAE